MNAASTIAGIIIAFVAVWSVTEQIRTPGSQELAPPARLAADAPMSMVAGAGAVELEVAGRVVDTHGNPVAGAVIVAATTGDAGLPGTAGVLALAALPDSTGAAPRAVTDAQGRFVIRGLAPGSYSLMALHGGYPPNARVEVAVRAGEDVFIVLDPDDSILV